MCHPATSGWPTRRGPVFHHLSTLLSHYTEVGYSQSVKRSRFNLAVDQEPSSFAERPNASNTDFDSIPPSKRTWHTGAYVAYWMADA